MVILRAPVFVEIYLTFIKSIIITSKSYFAKFLRANYDLSIRDHLKRVSHSNNVFISIL